MQSIRIQRLLKEYHSQKGGTYRALNELDFEVTRGEFVSVVGPSGCGKSTTLRCIAGLERPDYGEIRIGDRVVSSPTVFLPPNERPIGMVFQSYAIWPHMTVFENVAFPLREHTDLPEELIRDLVLMKLNAVGLRGAARGETLGFPTANLRPQNRVIPRGGVYVTATLIEGQWRRSVTNIGTRPTFGDATELDFHHSTHGRVHDEVAVL